MILPVRNLMFLPTIRHNPTARTPFDTLDLSTYFTDAYLFDMSFCAWDIRTAWGSFGRTLGDQGHHVGDFLSGELVLVGCFRKGRRKKAEKRRKEEVTGSQSLKSRGTFKYESMFTYLVFTSHSCFPQIGLT
jgi:hypothetical protein